MDHTVHVADLLRVLLESEPVTVFCEADNGILHGNFDDTGFLTITFENGVFATLDASWSRPKTFPTWGDVTLGVTGTRGVIELDMFAQEATHYDDARGRVRYVDWGSNIDAGLVAAWVRALASGQTVPVTAKTVCGPSRWSRQPIGASRPANPPRWNNAAEPGAKRKPRRLFRRVRRKRGAASVG
jgi:predicted dehydrogenase